MGEARVRVSLSDGVLEFEGSESFVTSQVEKFTKIIQVALAGERRIADVAAASDGGGTTDAGSNGAGGEASFVFGGRRKRQTLKLSAPGLHATAELIARLRTRGNGIASKRKGNKRDVVPTASRAMGSSPRGMATLVKSPR